MLWDPDFCPAEPCRRQLGNEPMGDILLPVSIFLIVQSINELKQAQVLICVDIPVNTLLQERQTCMADQDKHI